MADFPDMEEVNVGPTRPGRSINRTFVSVHEHVQEAGTVPPLETDDSDRRSDHLISYVDVSFPRAAAFQWITSVSYTHLTLPTIYSV